MSTLIRLRCVYGQCGPRCSSETWERWFSQPLAASESLVFKAGVQPARLIASRTCLLANTVTLTYRFQAPDDAVKQAIGEQLCSLGFARESP